ncbi:MAG TPA: hypothetical protein VIK27_12655 [Candidatus Aquilonibacter sp.]
MLIGAEDLVVVDASTAEVVRDPFARCRRSVLIDVAGETCAVHFDDGDAATCFASRYADLTVRDAVPARHAFAMRDRARGWLFWSPGGFAYRWPHGDLAAGVVAFLADAVALTAFFQQREDGIISLHAATVGLAAGVAAIVGDSNVGKTTTAVACARAGMDFYSDERCLIDRQSRIHPFPRAINVRAAGLRLLVSDMVSGADPIGARLRAQGAGDWNDVRISDLVPAQPTLEPRPLRAVFVLAGAGAEPALEPAPPSHAARASARWAQGAGAGLDKLARLLGVFASVHCYRLRLGTPDASARLIRTIVEAGACDLDRSA